MMNVEGKQGIHIEEGESMRLKDQIAVVTGVGGGIGEGFSYIF
jgi:hypothetical protein